VRETANKRYRFINIENFPLSFHHKVKISLLKLPDLEWSSVMLASVLIICNYLVK